MAVQTFGNDTMAVQTSQCDRVKELPRASESKESCHEMLEEGYTRFDSPVRCEKSGSGSSEAIAVPENEVTINDGLPNESENSKAISANSVSERTKQLARSLSLLGEVYSEQLEENPVRTKAITTGFLNLTGDLLAQHIEQHLDNDAEASLDKLRLLAMFIEGFCYSGPLLHYVFELYEFIFPIQCVEAGCASGFGGGLSDKDAITVSSTVSHASHASHSSRTMHPTPHAEYLLSHKKFLNAFLHVAFDQIIMAFPYVFGLMVIPAIIEGHASELGYELKHHYYKNVVASWAAALVIAPFQILAFRYLNVKWRVLWVNIQDVIWVAIMSYVTHRNRDGWWWRRRRRRRQD